MSNKSIPIKNPGYVYIVRCNEFYKVGIAHEIKARLSSLQIGNPYKVELMYAFRCNYPRQIEQAIHEMLEDNHIRGEWFELDTDALMDLMGKVLLFEKLNQRNL